MTKEFESIAELVQDPIFVQKVKDGIEELKKKRGKRPAPKIGYNYTRDWYDRLVTENHLNSEYFLSKIEDIWNKRPDLSMNFKKMRIITKLIDDICTNALYATHKYYQDLPDPAALKPKRSRKKNVLTVDQSEAAE